MVKIIEVIPPQILQFYDSCLLSRPMAKLRDDSETLWDIYLYIKRKLLKENSKRLRKKEIPKLEKEFLELYEQIKKKEEKIGKEKMDKRLFYYLNIADQRGGEIFSRLKLKS